jgi:cell division protein FtsN
MADSERRYAPTPTIDLQGFELRTDMDTVDEPSRLPLIVGIALVVLAAFAGVVWLAYTQGVQKGRESVSRELTAQEFWKLRKPAAPAYTGLKIYEPPSAVDQNAQSDASAKPQVANAVPALRPTASAVSDSSPAPVVRAQAGTTRSDNGRAGEPPMRAETAVSGKAAPAAQRVATRAPTDLMTSAAAPSTPMHPITAPDSFNSATPAPAAPAIKPAVSVAPPPQHTEEAPREIKMTTAATAGIALQIGSYKSEAEARQSWQAFKAKHDAAAGYQPNVREADLGARGTWYRLRMGPFPDRKSALETCRKLKADGASCLLAQ